MYVSSRGYDFGSLPAPGSAVRGCCSGMGGLNMDGSGLFGTGIFGNSVKPLDVSTWTWAEYATVALAAFTTYSVLSTTTQSYRTGRKRVQAIRRYVRSERVGGPVKS